jgi:hypothetical protein
MKNILIIILTIALLAACKKEEKENYEGFLPISENSMYNSLQVRENYVYYEIRNNYCSDSTKYDIEFSKGIKPYTDSIYSTANKGVFYSNGELCMYNTILTYNGVNYVFVDSYSGMMSFLGTIDCTGDALFIAHLNGYYFKYDDKAFGIKEDKDGFLIYACKLVSACTPVQTDKFLIKIDSLGNITILEQALLSKDEKACI